MAAPKSIHMRAFLGPAKRAIAPTPARFTPTTTTSIRSYSARRDDDGGDRDDSKAVDSMRADIAAGGMTLEERMSDMGIDAAEYKQLWRSQKKAEERFQAWEPKTREEAQQRWKELQNSPDHLTLLQMYKRAGVEPIKLAKERGITLPNEKQPLDPKTQAALNELRDPINVKAVHLRPLRRAAEHGVPVCDLQLRTYSIRNLLLFADFAVRAAYYMGLAARGPIPLPRITERWTVPRSNFIFKKSQENFERITMRRLIQIQDGHPDVVKAWLAFLQKHQYHGVGMKANIWEYEDLETATRAGYEIKEGDYSRRREGPMMDKVDEILNSRGYKEAMEEHKSEGTVEMRR